MTAGRPAEPAGRSATDRALRRAWILLGVENLALVAVFALVGVAAGWVWELWVTPPTGAVIDGVYNLGVRFDGTTPVRDVASVQLGFGVVATYVVVCLAVGLVLGVAAALLCRRSELVTLVVVAQASALAAFLVYRVGLALGPDDPAAVIAAADPGRLDGTLLAGDLSIEQLSPFVALPLAALLGLAITYLFTTGASAGIAEARRVEIGPRGGSPAPDSPTT